MNYIDLHVHSTESDGTMTPTELVRYSKEKGLTAFALTDHDTIAGIDEAIEEGKRQNIEVVSGIEFSTTYHKCDVHILGLLIDHNDPSFRKSLIEIQNSRSIRNLEMIKKLNKLGISINYNDVANNADESIITRAHFAQALVKKGYVRSSSDAFSKLIGKACPGYVPRKKVTPELAIDLIKKANGIPVLAHPLLYDFNEKELLILMEYLKSNGLMGIETIYSLNTPIQESYTRKLARRFGLLMTGGSDFHGSNKSNIDLGVGRGNLRVPYEILNSLKSAKI